MMASGGSHAGNGHVAQAGKAENAGRGGSSAGKPGAGSGGSAGKVPGGSGGKASGGKASAGTGGKASGGSSGNASGGVGGRPPGAAGTGAGSGGQSGAAGGGTTSLGAIEPAVDAYCGAMTNCCAPAEVTSLDACRARYAAHSSTLASLMSGALTVDPTVLAKCQAAFAGTDQCDQNVVWDACQFVFNGTRGANDSCANGWECDRSQGEMTCLITDSSNPNALGVCTPAPHAGLGEPCVTTCASGENCSSTTYGVGDTYSLCFEDDGLYCAYVGPGSECQALVPIGEPCALGPECGNDAYCTGSTCQPLAKLGEPCGDVPCRHELQCGVDGKCIDPMWADAQGCTDYPPLP
jgi:hypothetical protein